MKLMMENQGELMYNQSVLMMDRLGTYYRYFKDEAGMLKDVSHFFFVCKNRNHNHNRKNSR